METQEKKEQYALELIQSFGGNITHAINCVDRLIAMSEMEHQKEFNTQVRTIIANQGEALKNRVARVVKKKQLLFGQKVLESWKEFLGENFKVEIGQFCSSSLSGDIHRVAYDENNKNNGVLFIEYADVKTGFASIILENEWFYQINGKIEHLTVYVMENYSRFYDSDLNLITKK